MTSSAQKDAVALIVGTSEEARDVAFFTAARGIPVVLVGDAERTIAERVGEIVFGGGKARHLAGDPSSSATLVAAREKAESSFGRAVTHVVVDSVHAEACRRDLEALPEGRAQLVVLTGLGR